MEDHQDVRGRPLHQKRSRDRVALILSAARRIIASKGGSGLTISNLAIEAGMTPASVYRYFRDRTAVLRMLAEQASQLTSQRFHDSVTRRRQDSAGLSSLFGSVLDDLHTLYRTDPVLRDIWIAALAEPALDDIVQHHSALKLRIIMDVLGQTGTVTGRVDRQTDLSLCIEFVQTATLAALSLPAVQGKQVVDKAKEWFAPFLAAKY
jgi:AcrR family transcriptional regulator